MSDAKKWECPYEGRHRVTVDLQPEECGDIGWLCNRCKERNAQRRHDEVMGCLNLRIGEALGFLSKLVETHEVRADARALLVHIGTKVGKIQGVKWLRDIQQALRDGEGGGRDE